MADFNYHSFVALGVMLFLGTPSEGQSVAERRLPPSIARLSKGFSSISSLRELGDGRVLISDPREGALYLGDFHADRVEPVGRRGRGPAEYEAPGSLFPLPGDSTLMVHLGTRRALMLVGPRIVTGLPASSPIMQRALAVAGCDREGRVLIERRRDLEPPRQAGVVSEGAGDSTFLVLVHRVTGLNDTIGRARVAERRFEIGDGLNGGMSVRVPRANPLAVKEASRLAPDGWVAIVRRDPYRVDWRRPDGTWLKGPALPFSRIEVDEVEKVVVMQEWAADGLRREPNPAQFDDWPAIHPPFANSSVGPILLTEDGKVAIRRSRSARSPESRYDVVDRSGNLFGRVVLRSTQTLVGFGKGSVYLSTTDEDGLRWLSKHPWPP